MINGRSTCGSDSSSSGAACPESRRRCGASSLNIPLPSYCVRASPSISTCSISCALSSTSSWTSRPSAFAAACAPGLKLMASSAFSTIGAPVEGRGLLDSSVSELSRSSCSIAKSDFRIGCVGAAAAGLTANFPLARAKASAASPFIGSAFSRRDSHSASSSCRPFRPASSARARRAMMFSPSSSRTFLNTPAAAASSFLSTRHRA